MQNELVEDDDIMRDRRDATTLDTAAKSALMKDFVIAIDDFFDCVWLLLTYTMVIVGCTTLGGGLSTLLGALGVLGALR